MTVDFQPLATGVGANVESQSQYVTDLNPGGSLQNGYQSGIAKSAQVNKTLRQASIMAAAVANVINQQTGLDVLDDGNLTNLITILTSAIQQAAIRGTQAADIASAATVNLDTTIGWLVDVTGVATWTAVTLSQGRVRVVRHTGNQLLTHGSSLQLPGAANIQSQAGDYSIWAGYSSGVVRCVAFFRNSNFAKMTRTILTSGSGTYVPPTGGVRLKVTAVGGGGGGGGSGNGGGGSGGTGNNTTFGALTASGGNGGSGAAGQSAGGAATGGDDNIPGGGGTGSPNNTSGPGGCGGNSSRGGGGAGGGGGASIQSGGNAATNSGSGGGGGGNNGAITSGGGGGSGGTCIAWINNPAASYSYVVGGTASGGSAGTSGVSGGTGAAGIIIIEEYYS